MEDRESAGAPHGEPGITSEERLRLIEENVRDYAMFTFGPDRRISGWSRGAERILGYTEAEILGHSADLVFVPEDRQQDIPELEMQEAAAKGRAEDERWHLHKDGSRFWASGILTALRNEAGHLCGYVKILRDMTDRKWAAEARAHDQERIVEQERQAAVMQERNRMAREIHDTLAQSFTGISLQLEAAADILKESPEQAQVHLARARELARFGLAEARRSVWALRPEILDNEGLIGACQRLVESMSSGTGLAVRFYVDGMPYLLPSEIESDLIRIGQEALTNALKHARASEITLRLVFQPQEVQLRVQDNGRGFDPNAVPAQGGFGLTSMRERAEQMGGQWSVASQPGKGTEVRVTLPRPSVPPTEPE